MNKYRWFKELKESKEAEIAAGEEQLATKKQELADADEKLAQSKESKAMFVRSVGSVPKSGPVCGLGSVSH